MIRLLLVFVLMIIGLRATTQAPPCNLTLSGVVIDLEDGEPLPFAQIICIELERGVLADSVGFYQFVGMCPGEYTFECRHIGCLPLTINLTVSSNMEYNFYHEHIPNQLGEVEVKTERSGYRAIQGSERLTEKQLQLKQGKSLAEMLNGMSGVSVLRNGSTIGKPVVRGLHSNRLLIMNNGVRLEGQQWGNEHAPEIDPYLATRIQLVKGASSVRFGSDAIAGVVLVEPPAIRSAPGISGRINLAAISNGRAGVGNAILEGRLKKIPSLSWRAQTTFKRSGNVTTPTYYLKNTGLFEWNYSATGMYQHGRIQSEIYYSRFQSEIGIFSGAHIGNLTDLNLALQSEVPAESAGFTYDIGRPSQVINHEMTKASIGIQLRQTSRIKVIYARQYNDRKEFDKHIPLNDSLAALNRAALRFELTTHTLETLYESAIGKNFYHTWGAQGIAQANTYEGRFFIPNFRKNGIGFFAIERFHRNDARTEWELGMRYDAMKQEVFIREGTEVVVLPNRYQNFSANAGMVFVRNAKETYRFNIASAWRPPAINELYSDGLHHGVAAIEYGDQYLRTERSFGLELSGEISGEFFRIESQPFLQYIRNFIFLQPEDLPVLTIRGAFPAFHYAQTDAVLAGHDTRLTFDFRKHYRIGIKSSLLRATDAETGKHIVQMPSDAYEIFGEIHADRWNRLHHVFLKAEVQYRNKQWRVAATEDFAGSPAAYTLCNLQLGFDMPIQENFMSISLACDNIFNLSYRDYLNRFRYYSDEMGRSFVIRFSMPFDLSNKGHHHKEI